MEELTPIVIWLIGVSVGLVISYFIFNQIINNYQKMFDFDILNLKRKLRDLNIKLKINEKEENYNGKYK